uniref:Uncharacterized protein n=1 Tax=Anguilla anguilla TaxID=7936 RepID=A0A0E9UZU4_ANGAN
MLRSCCLSLRLSWRISSRSRTSVSSAPLSPWPLMPALRSLAI